MKILYLYSEVMGYTVATIDALAALGAEVHLVHWDKRKLTPYQVPTRSNVIIHKRSNHTLDTLTDLSRQLAPDITVVSGWMDKVYVAVARRLRRQGRVVVTCLDNGWRGRPRQWVAHALGQIGLFRGVYSHAWVPGVEQYAYARRLGFRRSEIIFDMYSADVALFNGAGQAAMATKTTRYPHRVLFVGRFDAVKGLDTLLDAWALMGRQRGDWELHLVGNGRLKPFIEAVEGVVVKDFMNPELLVKEISQAGCFVLPSRHEPWGVVVHEFAAAGLPLVVSDAVGAATQFLIHGMNGYLFKSDHAGQLAAAMGRVTSQSDLALAEMGIASQRLASRITPTTSVRNLLSVVA